MSVRPSVSLCIQDPENRYRYLSVQGTVVEIVEDGAKRHIDKLAQRYMGVEKYEGSPTEIRRLYRIRPEHNCRVDRSSLKCTQQGDRTWTGERPGGAHGHLSLVCRSHTISSSATSSVSGYRSHFCTS